MTAPRSFAAWCADVATTPPGPHTFAALWVGTDVAVGAFPADALDHATVAAHLAGHRPPLPPRLAAAVLDAFEAYELDVLFAAAAFRSPTHPTRRGGPDDGR